MTYAFGEAQDQIVFVLSTVGASALRIVYCHNRYQLRSGEDVAFDYASELLEQDGHELHRYVRNNSEISSFGLTDKISFPFRVTYSGRTTHDIKELISRHRPQVAVVQNVFPLMSPSLYWALAAADIPVVQLLFNYRFLCINGLFYTAGAVCEKCADGNYWQGVVRKCYRNSRMLSSIYAASLSWHRVVNTWKKCITLFVAPDQFLKRKMVEAGFSEARIKVISNPFDAAQYSPNGNYGAYALFVGRLIAAKGIFTLLQAAETSTASVVIAGDGEAVDSIRQHRAVTTGRVKFVGPVYGEEFKGLLSGASFVVVPSEWYDNLPMVVCQAFAQGKPVVAARINGIPEFVQHEKNGLLFTPGVVSELADCMSRPSSDPDLCRILGQEARVTAETVLSPRLWQKRMGEAMREAVQSHKG